MQFEWESVGFGSGSFCGSVAFCDWLWLREAVAWLSMGFGFMNLWLWLSMGFGFANLWLGSADPWLGSFAKPQLFEFVAWLFCKAVAFL